MHYTHKKNNLVVRIIYLCLIVLGFVTYNMGEGVFKTLLSTLSIVSIVTGLYLLIKYEMTVYTYVINEKDKDYDFFVNKTTGRRGNYVCYYYVSDAVKVVKYSKEARNELKNEFSTIGGYYSFCHNFLNTDKYIVVFKNTNYYDLIVLEMDEKFLSDFKNYMATADASSRSLQDEEDD